MDEMVVYCDTCCLVKFYVSEQHSDWVRTTLNNKKHLVTCRVAKAEIWSAITRRLNQKSVSPEQYQDWVNIIENDWNSLNIMDFDDDNAAMLARQHGLRGFDAIHLSSAILVQKSIKYKVDFCSFDKKLLQAAEKEGLQIAVPNDFLF